MTLTAGVILLVLVHHVWCQADTSSGIGYQDIYTSLTSSVAEIIFTNPANLPTGLSGPVACPSGLTCGTCYAYAGSNGDTATCCRCPWYMQNAPTCDERNENTFFSMSCLYTPNGGTEQQVECCWCQGGFSLEFGVANCADSNPVSSLATYGLGSTQVCLHGDGVVQVEVGGVVQDRPVRAVRPGDRVAVLSDDGTVQYDPVLVMAHSETELRTTFIKITTRSGRTITSTPKHFLLTGLSVPGLMKTSQAVQVGHFLLSVDPVTRRALPDRIVSKEWLNDTGIFSPVTLGGTLLVGGLQVSSYSDDVWPLSGRAAHTALWPLRQLHHFTQHPSSPLAPLYTWFNTPRGEHGMPLWLYVYYFFTNTLPHSVH